MNNVLKYLYFDRIFVRGIIKVAITSKYFCPPSMYLSLWPAPGIGKHNFGSIACSNSLLPIENGTMLSFAPCIINLGTRISAIVEPLL